MLRRLLPGAFRRRRSWRPGRVPLHRFTPALLVALAVTVFAGSDSFERLVAGPELPRTIRGGGAWGGVSAVPVGRGPSGKVTHVRDGDTIEVGGTAIRIAALDCAERGQPGAAAATMRMRALVSSGVSCSLDGRRSYDREVGSCRLPDGRDLAEAMIAEGMCRRWQ